MYACSHLNAKTKLPEFFELLLWLRIAELARLLFSLLSTEAETETNDELFMLVSFL